MCSHSSHLVVQKASSVLRLVGPYVGAIAVHEVTTEVSIVFAFIFKYCRAYAVLILLLVLHGMRG